MVTRLLRQSDSSVHEAVIQRVEGATVTVKCPLPKDAEAGEIFALEVSSRGKAQTARVCLVSAAEGDEREAPTASFRMEEANSNQRLFPRFRVENLQVRLLDFTGRPYAELEVLDVSFQGLAAKGGLDLPIGSRLVALIETPMGEIRCAAEVRHQTMIDDQWRTGLRLAFGDSEAERIWKEGVLERAEAG